MSASIAATFSSQVSPAYFCQYTSAAASYSSARSSRFLRSNAKCNKSSRTITSSTLVRGVLSASLLARYMDSCLRKYSSSEPSSPPLARRARVTAFIIIITTAIPTKSDTMPATLSAGFWIASPPIIIIIMPKKKSVIMTAAHVGSFLFLLSDITPRNKFAMLNIFDKSKG